MNVINQSKIYALGIDGYNYADEGLDVKINTDSDEESLLVEINGVMYKADDLLELLELIKHFKR